jgi:MIP family channel proteins
MSDSTDNFIPSPSNNSHTTPMDVQTPLIKSSSNPNTTLRSVTPTITKPESPTKSKVSKTSNKFFYLPQIKTLEFYQALLSEFLATMLLVLICTSTGLAIASKSVPDIHGALASGLIVATVVVGFGHISGAHINPAVTVTLLVASEIDFLQAFGYIIMQLLGATCGSGIVLAITPAHARNHLGVTMITEGVSLTQAFIVEFFITFILCYTVLAICDKRRDDIGGSKALIVGFVVTLNCLFAGPYTGASMNPARSFGPTVVMNSWENHWIYWLGPITGSITAALIYTQILKKRSSPIITHESNSLIDTSNI